MNRLISRMSPAQNLGLIDRIIRGVVAAVMVGLPFLNLTNSAFLGWHGYVILLGIYPAITTILGWDPIYSLFQVRSCSQAQCGTFPFEVAAAMGHPPIVNKGHEFDHSLTAAVADQRNSYGKDTMTPKEEMVQNRLLIFVLAILTVAVIAYLSYLS